MGKRKSKLHLRYAGVIEEPEGSLSACVPDLPGCVATGPAREADPAAVRAAIDMQLAELQEDSRTMPEPGTGVG